MTPAQKQVSTSLMDRKHSYMHSPTWCRWCASLSCIQCSHCLYAHKKKVGEIRLRQEVREHIYMHCNNPVTVKSTFTCSWSVIRFLLYHPPYFWTNVGRLKCISDTRCSLKCSFSFLWEHLDWQHNGRTGACRETTCTFFLMCEWVWTKIRQFSCRNWLTVTYFSIAFTCGCTLLLLDGRMWTLHCWEWMGWKKHTSCIKTVWFIHKQKQQGVSRIIGWIT